LAAGKLITVQTSPIMRQDACATKADDHDEQWSTSRDSADAEQFRTTQKGVQWVS
jgi:hypothetical protein